MLGYKHCTAVQAESLGPLLSGADMVVKAKTGTGKTLAFLIPGIEQVDTLSILWNNFTGSLTEASVSADISRRVCTLWQTEGMLSSGKASGCAATHART